MTTGFSDRDLASQCHCIPVAFFLHASCHYLLVAYLSSFQCQLDAQYNLQQAFLKQFIVTKYNEWHTVCHRDTRGFNAAFSQKIPSVSLVQFTVQMFKLNGLGKTHRERIFVVELKLKLRSLALSMRTNCLRKFRY